MTRALSPATFTPYLVIGANTVSSAELYPQLLPILRQKLPNLTETQLEWFNNEGSPLSIDQVRNLQQQCGYSTTGQKNRIWIITDIDQASLPAQHALLKLLEEPPVGIWIILTSAEVGRVLPTLQSRCWIVTLVSQNQVDSTTVADRYQTLCTCPAWQAISIADELSQKNQALTGVSELLFHLEHLQTKKVEKVRHRHQSILLTAYQQLLKNCNPKLTLEAAFFQLSSMI